MRHQSRRSSGFSLVEAMVAMVIGLVTVLVVTQVMQVAEARKRTASSGADANINATLGLFAIERDGKNSGYGMTSIQSAIGCPVRMKFASNATEQFNLAAASIEDGADGAPDAVRFLSSEKNGVTLPVRISVDHPVTAANFFVESDLGIAVGDMMVAVPSTITGTNWCSLFQVTGTGGAGGGGAGGGGNGGNNANNGGGQGQNQVLHNSGQSDWNQAGGQTIFPAGGYVAGDHLINLGSFRNHRYSINSNHLRLTSLDTTTNTANDLDLFPHIVQLQAVYGKDTTSPRDNIVDVWNATAPTTVVEWQQIVALRVALVARSQSPEPGTVTLDGASDASSCGGANPHPAAVCWRPDPNAAAASITLSHLPDWQRYRYRVVETTIPLRNAIWRQ